MTTVGMTTFADAPIRSNQIAMGHHLLTTTPSGKHRLLYILRVIPGGMTADGGKDGPRALVIRWNCPWLDRDTMTAEQIERARDRNPESRARFQVGTFFWQSEPRVRLMTLAGIGGLKPRILMLDREQPASYRINGARYQRRLRVPVLVDPTTPWGDPMPNAYGNQFWTPGQREEE